MARSTILPSLDPSLDHAIPRWLDRSIARWLASRQPGPGLLLFHTPPGWRRGFSMLTPPSFRERTVHGDTRTPSSGRPGRRRRTVRVLSASLLPAAVLALRLNAQSPSADAASTMDGIYTADQARRGEDTYMSICVGCHPAGTYTTQAFKATWSNRTVGDLFTLISQTMPQNEPASLSPQEYAQVIAYILKLNGVPAGRGDIPVDAERLKRIRIEMPSGPSPKK
jgi:mono/diheme cytochrome c family protein